VTNAACLPGSITDVLSALAARGCDSSVPSLAGTPVDVVFQDLLGLGLQQLDDAALSEPAVPLSATGVTEKAIEAGETPEAQLVRVLTGTVKEVVSQLAEVSTDSSTAEDEDEPISDDKDRPAIPTQSDEALIVALPVQTTVQREAVFTLSVPPSGASTEIAVVQNTSAGQDNATPCAGSNSGSTPVEPIMTTPQHATQKPAVTAGEAPVAVTGWIEPTTAAHVEADARTSADTGEVTVEHPAHVQTTEAPSVTSAGVVAEPSKADTRGSQPQPQAASTAIAEDEEAPAVAPATPERETETAAQEQSETGQNASSGRESHRKSPPDAHEPARHTPTPTGTVVSTAEPLRSSTSPSTSGTASKSDSTAATPTTNIPEPTTATGTVKDLAVKVETPGGGEVRLQFAESRGAVNLTLRTADESLATALKSDLPQLGARLQAVGWRSDLQAAASGSTPELTRGSDTTAAGERSASTRWQVETALRTDEAGMQFGAGGDGGRAASDAAEQEDDFLTLTALRRLSGLRDTL